MIYNPVGIGEIELNTIILDLNGTLSVNGKVVDGAKERIKKLKGLGFTIYLFTGDQRGTASTLASELGIEMKVAKTSSEKEMLAKQLDTQQTVAIGNARIDIGTFKHSRVRIGTMQEEGIHTEILKHIDILVPSINDAFDLLIDESSFNATMRK